MTPVSVPVSVIVANVCPDEAAIAPGLAALGRELRGEDEVVWVDGVGLAPSAPRMVHVDGAGEASRGPLYARGLAAARHPFVAFTDSRTELQPGWRHALDEAFAAGADVVGGPVLPGSRASMADAAGFLVEYGVHAAPPWVGASGDVSANNVAYRRARLAEVLAPGEPVWKSVVDERLAARGSPPVLVPGMRVVSRKRYGWADVGRVRVAHGRLYSGQRAGDRAWPARLAAAAGCAALPALAYARLAARVAGAPELRALLLRSTPAVLVALAAWSAGEAWGWLAGEGRHRVVF